MKFVYPPSPRNIDRKITDPSPEFRKEALGVLTTIVFFMVVYFLLMIAAFLLAAGCAMAGFALAINFPRFFTLMIAVGLVGLGLLVVFFLVKFIFKKNKVDRSHLIELREQDQPELFAFIRQLTLETQTAFPKKIYLSPEVNASVFYDSSFWSMFFPIRKNLQIGLALVNSINMSEFKAILAHEFGHFSQKSMKLGSYVYNVNQIIYNMLYDNDGYNETIQGFANVSNYFAFFAGITVRIVKGIQFILQKIYGIINKQYLSLSRQMEFHADSVAASVAGSDHLITSLYRLELANHSYSQLFDYYNLWLKDNWKPINLYPQHTELMKHFAIEQDIAIEHDLPHVTKETLSRFDKTRIVVKDQWASHPSTKDRDVHLSSLGIKADKVTTSAWAVFRNVEDLQKNVTEKIYGSVKFKGTPAVLDFTSFTNLYLAETGKYRLSDTYKGFFNGRDISKADPSQLINRKGEDHTLEKILSEHTLNLPFAISGLKQDIQTLSAIQNGSIAVKTFDFDGERFNKDDAASLSEKLEKELKESEGHLIDTDSRLITFFLQAAAVHGQQNALIDLYVNLFRATDAGSIDLKKSTEIQEAMGPIYYENNSADGVIIIMAKVGLNEPHIKTRLEQMLTEPIYAPFITDESKEAAEKYIKNNYTYFDGSGFYDENLNILNRALGIYNYLIHEGIFKLKKDLLDGQLAYIR